MRRGLTLLELLISLSIVVVITLAFTRAYELAIGFDQRIRSSRDQLVDRQNFENTVANLLKHSYLSSSTTNQNSYFIGGSPTVSAAPSGLPSNLRSTLSTSSTPGGAATSSSGSSSGGNATGAYGTPNTVVFTAAGLPMREDYLASNDDFETQNQNFGPQGGLREIEISQNPVGSQGQGKTGVFLRTQTPSDNDPTQGGDEILLSDQISQLGFEFFDGQAWQTSWDNRSQTPAPGKLPPAVRVTYRFKGDSVDHVFVVEIPASGVNYLSPVTVTG